MSSARRPGPRSQQRRWWNPKPWGWRSWTLRTQNSRLRQAGLLYLFSGIRAHDALAGEAPGPGPRPALDRPGLLAILLKALTTWGWSPSPHFFKDAGIWTERGISRDSQVSGHPSIMQIIIIIHTVLFFRSLFLITFRYTFQIYALQKAARPVSSACAVWAWPANVCSPRAPVASGRSGFQCLLSLRWATVRVTLKFEILTNFNYIYIFSGKFGGDCV